MDGDQGVDCGTEEWGGNREGGGAVRGKVREAGGKGREVGPQPLSQRESEEGWVKERRLATKWSMCRCRRGAGFRGGAETAMTQAAGIGQSVQSPSPQINGGIEVPKP